MKLTYLTSRALDLKFNPQFLGTKRTINPPIAATIAACKAAAPDKYTRTGLCAIIGNADDGNDVIQPGAFTKAIAEFNSGNSRIRHLWNHDATQPPIASVKALRELTRSEMPKALLALDPNISGGLLVTREYYPNNALSEWILMAIDRGDIKEMSFAFDVVRDSHSTMGEKRVRLLHELSLFDSSDVLWGMNSRTMAVVSKSFPPPKNDTASLQRRMRALQVEKLKLMGDSLSNYGGVPQRATSATEDRFRLARLKFAASQI